MLCINRISRCNFDFFRLIHVFLPPIKRPCAAAGPAVSATGRVRWHRFLLALQRRYFLTGAHFCICGRQHFKNLSKDKHGTFSFHSTLPEVWSRLSGSSSTAQNAGCKPNNNHYRVLLEGVEIFSPGRRCEPDYNLSGLLPLVSLLLLK